MILKKLFYGTLLDLYPKFKISQRDSFYYEKLLKPTLEVQRFCQNSRFFARTFLTTKTRHISKTLPKVVIMIGTNEKVTKKLLMNDDELRKS